MNMDKFRKRHPDKIPVLIELHETLDALFDQWVNEHGHGAKYEEAKTEYRQWVKITEPLKEEFAQRRAAGKTATHLAERAAMFALRIVLPPSVYTLVKTTMTAAQVVNDLLKGERNGDATGLLLQTTIHNGLALMTTKKRLSKCGNNLTLTTPRL